jgi:hypothetical protein
MNRRPWKPGELELLAHLYGQGWSGQACAAALGRTLSSVEGAIERYGLKRGAHPKVSAAEKLEIARLNALGWPDTHIADLLGHERHSVSEHRKRLGLPSREKGEVWRQAIARGARRQLDRMGLTSMGQLRQMAFMARALRAGWPADLRPRAVQMLDLLHDRGPQIRRQIAAALKMPWKGSRKSLCSNDPEGSYLAHLMARGLVVSLGRVVKGVGRGRSCHLYALAPEVTRGPRPEQTRDTG